MTRWADRLGEQNPLLLPASWPQFLPVIWLVPSLDGQARWDQARLGFLDPESSRLPQTLSASSRAP